MKKRKQDIRVFPSLKKLDLPWAFDFNNPELISSIPKPINPDVCYDAKTEFATMCQQNLWWMSKYVLGIDLAVFQLAILKEMFTHPFLLNVSSRGASKSFICAVYALMKALLQPNCKIVMVGSCWRQAKVIFDYVSNIYSRSSVLQKSASIREPQHLPDIWKMQIGTSTISAVPLGIMGGGIRGLRAHVILADEFATIPETIFDVVIRGFAVVSQDPVATAKDIAAKEMLIEQGAIIEDEDEEFRGNQIILSGTASWKFNHMYKTYDLYKKIIDNKIVGSTLNYPEIFGYNQDGEGQNVNYKDFCIIQIPYTKLPDGFLDKKIISDAKMSMSKPEFDMEFMARFGDDTEGFFKMSTLNNATVSPSPDGRMSFYIKTHGDGGKKYVIGVDPARWHDNFAMAIFELHEDFYALVDMVVLNKFSYPNMARMIRAKLKAYPTTCYLAMDSGGGGHAIRDILQDPTNTPAGESLIWEANNKETASNIGLHILEMIGFNQDWISKANHGLRSDLENNRCLFPPTFVPGFLYGKSGRKEDLDKILEEIKEAKREMTSIIVTATGHTGKEHFDIDKLMGVDSVTRKDRYSAILLGSYAARHVMHVGISDVIESAKVKTPIGGFVDEFAGGEIRVDQDIKVRKVPQGDRGFVVTDNEVCSLF